MSINPDRRHEDTRHLASPLEAVRAISMVLHGALNLLIIIIRDTTLVPLGLLLFAAGLCMRLDDLDLCSAGVAEIAHLVDGLHAQLAAALGAAHAHHPLTP